MKYHKYHFFIFRKLKEFKVEALEASSSTPPPSQASYMGWIRKGGTRFPFFLPHMVAIRFITKSFTVDGKTLPIQVTFDFTAVLLKIKFKCRGNFSSSSTKQKIQTPMVPFRPRIEQNISFSISYQISKHAVVALTRSFGDAKVVRKTGIKVVVIREIYSYHCGVPS